MAPSAVEAGKGKGKVHWILSLRRVCGFWLLTSFVDRVWSSIMYTSHSLQSLLLTSNDL
jgi:hypothetical protein